jgi:hypothetical protein
MDAHESSTSNGDLATASDNSMYWSLELWSRANKGAVNPGQKLRIL